MFRLNAHCTKGVVTDSSKSQITHSIAMSIIVALCNDMLNKASIFLPLLYVMDIIKKYKVESLFFILCVAIIFYQLSQSSEKTLMALLLLSLWMFALYYYYMKDKTEKVVVGEPVKSTTDIPKGKEIATNNYYVKNNPNKGLEYLKNNETLLKIVKDLAFVKTFDAQKYNEMCIYMNSYQKVYMYILAERYLASSYIQTFLDLRENILEIMYQYYVVVPQHLKHIYGVSPYEKIEKNVNEFLKLSRTMIEVLENFCRMDLKEKYFPTTNPMPHDVHNEKDKKHVLP
jgi:hypothetical protein